MATTRRAQRPAAPAKAPANSNDAARAAEEARRSAAAIAEVPERQPGDDLDAEDLAQFDG